MSNAGSEDEYCHFYGDEVEEKPVHAQPTPSSPRRKVNRRGSVTEHIIRAQQEFLRSLKGLHHLTEFNRTNDIVSQTDPDRQRDQNWACAPVGCGIIEEEEESERSTSHSLDARPKLARRGSISELITKAQEYFILKPTKDHVTSNPSSSCTTPTHLATDCDDSIERYHEQSPHRFPTTRAA